jgi:hypothetical protein
MSSDTIQKLASITDAAFFERIATSVLRSANPAVYANISHQGVNADGKTVKAPLDNLGWIYANGESTLVAAAHTTASRQTLNNKWLHDPATVTPRKNAKKPTQPAGDLVKAISELEKLRQANPSLKATLALTCNQEEPIDVRVKAETLAASADIHLDIWSVSRIAQYLDTNADGQAIRHLYLGTPTNLLSKAELIRAGQLSLSTWRNPTDSASMITRTKQLGTTTGHVFLSGASGMGKTTLCFELLRDSFANGQAGLVLSAETLRDALSIEEAIGKELRRYLPGVEQYSGVKALELCSEISPLIVVIEDISRAVNTEALLSKLIDWTLPNSAQKSKDVQRNWRLLCPVWPRYLALIEKRNDRHIHKAGLVHTLGLYSEQEAMKAIQQLGQKLGKPQSDWSATAIAQALGNDPLLIGLYEFAEIEQTQDAISQYVANKYDRAAVASQLTVSDIEGSVNRLMAQMLVHKNLAPTWEDALGWLPSEDDKNALRALVKEGNVLRLTRLNGKESFEARHDRVLHSLIATCIAARLRAGIKDEFLADPYFAEHIGAAAVQTNLPDNELQQLTRESPLIAFFALKDAIAKKSDYLPVAIRVIENWLTPSEREPSLSSQRWRAANILAEIDSPVVCRIASRFPQADHFTSLLEAKFRNGDLAAGLNLVTQYPFETTVRGQRELIEHILSRYGNELTTAVRDILLSEHSTPRAVLGALYLAGYIGEPILAQAVRTAWRQTQTEERNLEAFLWAAARVCGDEADITLGPVCDAWAQLPDPKDDQSFTQITRSSLAAHGVSWKFRDYPPRAALPYFVSRAAHEDLRWPITYMLRGIDDPVAIRHQVEHLATLSRDTDGKGGFIDTFVKDEWRRSSEERGCPMSQESKTCLLQLAIVTSNDKHLRKQAFKLWEVSVSSDDVAIAQAVSKDSILHDTAVWARARRGDVTVIPELVEKIKTDGHSEYWWHACKYVWADALTTLIDESILQLSNMPAEQQQELGAWLFPEHLLRLEIAVAQQILIKHWDKLRVIPKYVQVALLLATPELVKLANEAIATVADKPNIFKHLSFTAGIKIHDRAGLTRESQLHALQPHLAFLSEYDLFALWETCNKRGWKQFRQAHIDPLLSKSESFSNRLHVDPPFDMSDLDEQLEGKRQSRAYWWMETQLRNGADRAELFKALLAWVNEKKTLAAIQVAGEIYKSDANRNEFYAFEKLANSITGSAQVVKHVRFEVFNRTLN